MPQFFMGDFALNSVINKKNITHIIKPNALHRVAKLHKLMSKTFVDQTSIDNISHLIVILLLRSLAQLIYIRTRGSSLPSLQSIFQACHPTEREIYDMFGQFFYCAHNLRRLLCDYSFKGFPLLKTFPVTGNDVVIQQLAYLKHVHIALNQKLRIYFMENSWNFLNFLFILLMFFFIGPKQIFDAIIFGSIFAICYYGRHLFNPTPPPSSEALKEAASRKLMATHKRLAESLTNYSPAPAPNVPPNVPNNPPNLPNNPAIAPNVPPNVPNNPPNVPNNPYIDFSIGEDIDYYLTSVGWCSGVLTGVLAVIHAKNEIGFIAEMHVATLYHHYSPSVAAYKTNIQGLFLKEKLLNYNLPDPGAEFLMSNKLYQNAYNSFINLSDIQKLTLLEEPSGFVLNRFPKSYQIDIINSLKTPLYMAFRKTHLNNPAFSHLLTRKI